MHYSIDVFTEYSNQWVNILHEEIIVYTSKKPFNHYNCRISINVISLEEIPPYLCAAIQFYRDRKLS